MPKSKLDVTLRSKRVRVTVALKRDALRALDDFRFTTRMPSRTAAFREILRRGLEQVLTSTWRNDESRIERIPRWRN